VVEEMQVASQVEMVVMVEYELMVYRQEVRLLQEQFL